MTASIDPGTIANDGQRILGSKMGSAQIAVDVPNLVALYQEGRLKLDELISGRYPLDQINEAIARSAAARRSATSSSTDPGRKARHR